MLGVSPPDYMPYLLGPRVRSDVFSEIMRLALAAVWLPRAVAEACLHPTCSVIHWSRSLRDSPRGWGFGFAQVKEWDLHFFADCFD